jgi:hypothetical protein
MKIAYFTEAEFEGKVPKNYPSLKGGMAWISLLDATHFNIYNIPSNIDKKYDLGIFNIPKTKVSKLKHRNLIDEILSFCIKSAYIQEGPHWYWQDYTLDEQIWYLNTISTSDIIYTHNKIDQSYYKGLLNHSDVRIMKSIMIPPKNITPPTNREGVMIGGNMCSWYGGFDSYLISQEFQSKIYAPSMGRKVEGEESLNITHLPYMQWNDFMEELNKIKYAIHLMKTFAMGTFALNCAYLGIPCIGYKGLDTQEICHPNCSVEIGDLKGARTIAQRLKKDSSFYEKCGLEAKANYNTYYNENDFLSNFTTEFKNTTP